MKCIKATIKEVGNPHLLTPEWHCSDDTTERDAVKFWGLEHLDIEWYKIEIV